MKNSRIDIGSIRREQILEAATAVITEQGFQNLSLSSIEKKAGMSRGQLTYYFPTKEEILLALFDRHVQGLRQQIGTPEQQGGDGAGGWEWVQHLLEQLLGQPPVSPEFHCLQYAFLSQIAHRPDFRRCLASLYEGWRQSLAQGLANDLSEQPTEKPISPRDLATLIQALLHGLTMQAAADPNAFEPQEMLDLCLDMVGSYLGVKKRGGKNPRTAANKNMTSNGTHAPARDFPGDQPPRGDS